VRASAAREKSRAAYALLYDVPGCVYLERTTIIAVAALTTEASAEISANHQKRLSRIERSASITRLCNSESCARLCRPIVLCVIASP